MPFSTVAPQDGSELDCVQGLGEVGTGYGKGLPDGRSAEPAGNGAACLDQAQAQRPLENKVSLLGVAQKTAEKEKKNTW